MEEKTYKLEITEKELKNPQIKRAINDLIILRAQLQSAGLTFTISEAELEIMPFVKLFTPIREYGEKKYPGEIGKLKGSRVILRKEN